MKFTIIRKNNIASEKAHTAFRKSQSHFKPGCQVQPAMLNSDVLLSVINIAQMSWLTAIRAWRKFSKEERLSGVFPFSQYHSRNTGLKKGRRMKTLWNSLWTIKGEGGVEEGEGRVHPWHELERIGRTCPDFILKTCWERRNSHAGAVLWAATQQHSQ